MNTNDTMITDTNSSLSVKEAIAKIMLELAGSVKAPKSATLSQDNNVEGVATLSEEGSVGKTTTLANIVLPGLVDEYGDKASAIFIEQNENSTISATDSEEEIRVKAKNMGSVLKNIDEVLLLGKAGVDFGVNDLPIFLEAAPLYEGVEKLFSRIVIPCTPTKKSQQCAISTAKSMIALGTKKKDIRIIFNFASTVYDSGESIETEFSIVIEGMKRGVTRLPRL